ncbi:MAG: TetR family transcriptional regulator [Gemmatimonadetes bacterium]|nr:TetR family transcriptional regulator [Gemmatimonadota bacterium]
MTGRMIASRLLTVSRKVAKRVGVSPATLYRYFPGGRSGLAGAT